MLCNNCGKTLHDDATFCPYCGTSVNDTAYPAGSGYSDQSGYPSYSTDYNTSSVSSEQADLADRILKFGILTMALCIFGIPGFIFGIKKRKLVKEYLSSYGRLNAKARVGHIIGQVGFVFSIIFSVFVCFFIIIYLFILINQLVMGIAMCSSSHSSYSYYLISLFP